MKTVLVVLLAAVCLSTSSGFPPQAANDLTFFEFIQLFQLFNNGGQVGDPSSANSVNFVQFVQQLSQLFQNGGSPSANNLSFFQFVQQLFKLFQLVQSGGPVGGPVGGIGITAATTEAPEVEAPAPTATTNSCTVNGFECLPMCDSPVDARSQFSCNNQALVCCDD